MATPRICSVEGCDKPARTRGLCPTHYARLLRHGDASLGQTRVRGECSAKGCAADRSAKGYCGRHYRKWRRYGDPLAGETRSNSVSVREFLNQTVRSHDSDECLLWPYHCTKKGYAVISLDGRRTTASRYVCETYNGPPPSSEHQAAHSCGNGHLGCVNKHHLRWATPVENQGDRRSHGTMIEGSLSNFAKLTEDDVLRIRKMREEVPVGELAAMFNCTTGNIWAICARKTWGHI